MLTGSSVSSSISNEETTETAEKTIKPPAIIISEFASVVGWGGVVGAKTQAHYNIRPR